MLQRRQKRTLRRKQLCTQLHSFRHSFVQMDFESDQEQDPIKAHHKNFDIGATLDFSQVSS